MRKPSRIAPRQLPFRPFPILGLGDSVPSITALLIPGDFPSVISLRHVRTLHPKLHLARTGRAPPARPNHTCERLAEAAVLPTVSAEFPIYKLLTSLEEQPETLGSKEKFWISPTAGQNLPEEPHLFKIGRPNTGENWSEKVCCELAILAGLPCASYEFAETEGGTKGVLSRRFIDKASRLILGNMFNLLG